jgi:hypothetical protein
METALIEALLSLISAPTLQSTSALTGTQPCGLYIIIAREYLRLDCMHDAWKLKLKSRCC